MKRFIILFIMCLIVRRVAGQDDGFKVYPNSTSGVVHIECGGRCVDSLTVEVFDVYGKVVVSDQIMGSYHIINIDSLENGMYFIRMSGCSEDKEVKYNQAIVKSGSVGE